MFHDIPQAMLERMRHLESIDAADRTDGTHQRERLRQIPPETGKFLAITAASAPAGDIIEIGTSAGYSTMWLALAARHTGRKIITFELMSNKIALATETFKQASVEDVVTLVHGDALELLKDYHDVAFCFLDAEKEIYRACYDLVLPNMVAGGLLAADNAINQRDKMDGMIEYAETDPRTDALVVPVGKGVLLSRKI